MSQLTAFAQTFQSRTASWGEADYDDHEDRENVLSGGDCDTILRFVKDPKHKGYRYYTEFKEALVPPMDMLLRMAGGSDEHHLKALANARKAFLSEANITASRMGLARKGGRPDEKSETLLTAMCLAMDVLKRVGGESGGRSPLPNDEQEAALEAVQELTNLRESARNAWGRIADPQTLSEFPMARGLGKALRVAFRNVKTFKTVTSRAEIALSLPIVGAYTLFEPIYSAVLSNPY